MQRFLNKIVLVTGASSGLGEAIADGFLKNGANVINADLNPPKADRGTDFVKTDVRCDKSVQELMAGLQSKYGRLDVLVNNAGIYAAGGLEHGSIDGFQTIMDVNYFGFVRMIKYGIPLLQKGGQLVDVRTSSDNIYETNIGSSGAIINISSVAAMTPSPPNSIAYCTSKAAGGMLTKCIAAELAKFKIRINDVCPGPIYTPIQGALAKGADMSVNDLQVVF